MKIKTLLQSCTVSYIDIVLISYYEPTSYHEPHYRQIDIEIRNRKDFYDFIASYGNSDVFDWAIESVEGIPYMIFDLENLVEKVQPKKQRRT